MDYLKDILETFLAPVVSGILLYVIGKIGKVLIELVKKKIAELDNVALQAFIRTAACEVVLYIQQKYETLSNTEKFEKAVAALESKVDDFTEKLNLGRNIISSKDIEMAIEAAVKSLKDNWKTKNP